MSYVIFEKPVFVKLTDGTVHQLISFNSVIGGFKIVDIKTGSVSIYTEPLDAEQIDFTTKFKKFNWNVVHYLLSSGVDMLFNIPDWVLKRLNQKLIFNLFIHQIERINRMLENVSEHETDFGTILYDSYLQNLCCALLMDNNRINFNMIDVLNERGIKTRPLNDKYGWVVPVIETKRGLLIFS